MKIAISLCVAFCLVLLLVLRCDNRGLKIESGETTELTLTDDAKTVTLLWGRGFNDTYDGEASLLNLSNGKSYVIPHHIGGNKSLYTLKKGDKVRLTVIERWVNSDGSIGKERTSFSVPK